MTLDAYACEVHEGDIVRFSGKVTNIYLEKGEYYCDFVIINGDTREPSAFVANSRLNLGWKSHWHPFTITNDEHVTYKGELASLTPFKPKGLDKDGYIWVDVEFEDKVRKLPIYFYEIPTKDLRKTIVEDDRMNKRFIESYLNSNKEILIEKPRPSKFAQKLRSLLERIGIGNGAFGRAV